LENEVLLNATYLFIIFILLKICNILTGCYNTPLVKGSINRSMARQIQEELAFSQQDEAKLLFT